MGVYIKGVEIPKNCAGCALYRFGCTMEGECWSMCAASGKDLDNPFNIGIPVWCPLVPVPPHGRLIDADEMQESIRRQVGFLKLMGGKLSDVAEMVEKGFLQEIANAPTIIPADPEEEEMK